MSGIGGDDEAPASKRRAMAPSSLSLERLRAEALMCACIKRLGEHSPAALMVCDTYLARDFWTTFVRARPVASQALTWGYHGIGNIGRGAVEAHLVPLEVPLHGQCIRAVTCGSSHTMVVVEDGELWATGGNFSGQLGLGDTQDRSSFTRVSGLSGKKVAVVACGYFHTLALLESGELFAWGHNEHGQLGLGDTIERTTPVLVTALSGRRIAAIACGGGRSVTMLETGDLFVWGWNEFGQLGLGDNAYRTVPTQVTALAGKRVITVSCGGSHTAAVTESGELFTWGYNFHAQLGHSNHVESKNTPQIVEALRGCPVADVACGSGHTLALLQSGDVYAWGENGQGQLGLGHTCDGSIGTPQRVCFFDGKHVESVHGGSGISGVVLESGEAFVWGQNFCGQLGIGTTPYVTTPVQIDALVGKRILSIAFGWIHVAVLVE